MLILKETSMKVPWRTLSCFCLSLLLVNMASAQDYGDGEEATPPPAMPKSQEMCNGIYLTYDFTDRQMLYPHVKNASAQAWSFDATASVVNMGLDELPAWRVFIGFQHDESLVTVEGATVVDVDGPPYKVGKNGTLLSGNPKTDLKTAVDTAGDFEQMRADINIKGTLFGGKANSKPMPKSIKLANDGFKCPAATKQGQNMHVCCKRDPKSKVKKRTTKFAPLRYGDLTFTYDILQAFTTKYLAQVTINNNHPLSRLDRWKLTWEWQKNEFIYSMRGAFTHKKDASECIYGPQGKYYKDLDFTNVENCQKKPSISDLPPEKEKDEKLGNLPYCCKNGTLLPKTMNETKSMAIFQMEVFKLPPDLDNRTAFTPPSNWQITGQLNPTYKCSAPVRVDPSQFPDSNGLDATTSAVASWQITCNMTRPKPQKAKCCVSYSAYYAASAIPCNTCACGCEDDAPRCNAKAAPLELPPNALLLPFANRTQIAKAWYSKQHKNDKEKKFPTKMPCPDNCGMSLNWHLESDYSTGWTARLTLFNWGDLPFEDWFTAIQMKEAYEGYENVYSFNGTKLENGDKVKNTIFMQGLPGLNYLIAETNSSHPDREPPIPGKQQSVISFTKTKTPGIDVPGGDGFPTRLYFNGEECALPKEFPKRNGASRSQTLGVLPAVLVALLTTLVLLMDRLH